MRLKSDICYKLKLNLRRRTRVALKNDWKSGSAVRNLGCSVEFLKERLESMFYSHPKTGKKMTWDNWGVGRGKWNIDHIKPLDSFDLADRKQFLEACHYTNLQPLWFEDNMRKGNK